MNAPAIPAWTPEGLLPPLNVALPERLLAERATYWDSLLAQRRDGTWKGYVELDLGSEHDAEAAPKPGAIGGSDAMKAQEYQSLLAEHRQVQRMYGETPLEFVIDRDFLAARLEALGQEIAAALLDEPKTIRVAQASVGEDRAGAVALDEVQADSANPAAVDR